ncbi:PREDICTED: LOC110745657 [Prunus dulcis]|uniref:PREDICTED: LOC110745657 n=1 Tax=Prunus dulcis TaxID=3755 RepID=A0A5E4FS45_PRUDU|nr:PREDICTED: LOC110745657 [Prunus dulcis]
MGRDWIHKMDGEASTRCQVMRCLIDDGLGTIDIKGVYLSGEVSPPSFDNNLSIEKSLNPYQSAGDDVQNVTAQGCSSSNLDRVLDLHSRLGNDFRTSEQSNDLIGEPNEEPPPERISIPLAPLLLGEQPFFGMSTQRQKVQYHQSREVRDALQIR